MKKITVFSALALALTLSQLARADFNTDDKKGSIKCSGDDVEVKIDAQRKVISIHWSGDEAGWQTYDVVNRDGDGDTYVSYVSLDNEVVLSFSDRGDSLEVTQTKENYDLKCK